MSTKTNTNTNTNLQYDPTSLGVYKGLQSGIGGTLSDFIKNPLASTFFNQMVGMGANAINTQGATGMQSLLSNLKTSGQTGGTTSPFAQFMIGQQGRATSSALASNFMQNLFNSRNMQLQATGMAQAYNPLMTGQASNQVSTQSGLGTWLPQLAGAALGGLTGGLSGGLGSLFKGLGGGAYNGVAGMSPGGDFGSGLAPTAASGVMGTVPGSYAGSLNMDPSQLNPLLYGLGANNFIYTGPVG